MEDIYEFPLKQSIGEEVVPVVVKGDIVKRGQLLAFQGKNTLGANLFSSVNGTVSDLDEKAVYIRADKNQNFNEYVALTKEQPLDLIKEAGIVGLGGAGFPTYVKLSTPFCGQGTVIINAAECEPILSHNIKRIERDPKQLLRGLEIAMDIVHATDGVIAIKAKHAEAIKKLEEANQKETIRIARLEDCYPMGEERAVIREVLGVLLPVTALPLEANAIVINAETACRIQEAVDLKKPFIDKDMTVAGKIAGNHEGDLKQEFLDVPLGTKVEKMFLRSGGVADSYGELIMGGPFTGKRTTMDAPVVKTTGGLIASECFLKGPERIGVLVCACGADKDRMCEMAQSMQSSVVGVEYCKQAKLVNGKLKCENPGRCPGQVQKVLALKKAGAQALLIGNCTDCSNTVMSCAPKLGLPVYHSTDGALRAVNDRIIRKAK